MTSFLFPPTRVDSGGGGEVGEVPHVLTDNGLDAVETRWFMSRYSTRYSSLPGFRLRPTYGTIRRYGVGPQTYAQGLGSRPTRLDVCRRLGDRGRMNELLVGYARVWTEQQDLTAQRNGLHALGVGDDRIYVDHGLTGTNRDRPGLQLALAACRAVDTLMVTKLDRLARSLPDARDILDELTRRNVKLSLGGSIHDPTDPVGRLLFNVLAMVAEFETDLIRLRTREGMKVAKAKGRLRGKQPKLKPNQAKHLLELHDSGTYTQAELAELFGVGRSTIYRTKAAIHAMPRFTAKCYSDPSAPQSGRLPNPLSQTCPMGPNSGRLRYA
jgi:DNA invertase Pin-like site-specific DNA recombinase